MILPPLVAGHRDVLPSETGPSGWVAAHDLLADSSRRAVDEPAAVRAGCLPDVGHAGRTWNSMIRDPLDRAPRDRGPVPCPRPDRRPLPSRWAGPLAGAPLLVRGCRVPRPYSLSAPWASPPVRRQPPVRAHRRPTKAWEHGPTLPSPRGPLLVCAAAFLAGCSCPDVAGGMFILFGPNPIDVSGRRRPTTRLGAGARHAVFPRRPAVCPCHAPRRRPPPAISFPRGQIYHDVTPLDFPPSRALKTAVARLGGCTASGRGPGARPRTVPRPFPGGCGADRASPARPGAALPSGHCTSPNSDH